MGGCVQFSYNRQAKNIFSSGTKPACRFSTSFPLCEIMTAFEVVHSNDLLSRGCLEIHGKLNSQKNSFDSFSSYLCLWKNSVFACLSQLLDASQRFQKICGSCS